MISDSHSLQDARVRYDAVGANVAQGKPTTQSGTAYGGGSSRAVDANLDPDYGGGSCTHTTLQDDPWLKVDLEASYNVTTVRINRVDQPRRPCWQLAGRSRRQGRRCGVSVGLCGVGGRDQRLPLRWNLPGRGTSCGYGLTRQLENCVRRRRTNFVAGWESRTKPP